MSAYYHICPRCGASLDPGERCDCLENPRELYRGYIGKALQSGRVPGVLRPFCQSALADPCAELHLLRTLCEKLKDYAEN